MLPLLAVPAGLHARTVASAAAPRAPLVSVRHSSITPNRTGGVTLATAKAWGFLYPVQARALQDCGASSGVTEALTAQGWSLAAARFACRDPGTARGAVAAFVAEQRAAKWVSTPVSQAGVFVFEDRTAGIAGYPAVFHVVYASGTASVSVAVVAKTHAAGQSALGTVVSAITKLYPPSP